MFNSICILYICICILYSCIIPTHQTQEKMHSAVVQVGDHKHLILSLKGTKPYSYKLLQMKIPQHTTVGGNKHLLIFLKATSSYHSEQIQTQTNTIHIQMKIPQQTTVRDNKHLIVSLKAAHTLVNK